MKRYTRHRQAGLTLVELMAAVGCVAFITVNFGWIATQALHLTSEEATSSSFNERTRIALDTIRQDLNESNAVLSSETAGATTYTASSSVLILQMPWYTYSGASVGASGTDVVVYHLVGSGPYTLNRYLVASAGSPRGTSGDTVIMGNIRDSESSKAMVSSVTFNCFVQSTGTGDGSTTTFALANVPVLSTTSATSSAIVTNGSATVNLTATSPAASFTSTGTYGSLAFTSAPASGNAIDILYPVDASQSAYDSYVSLVSATINLSITTGGLATAAQSQTLTIGTEGKLLER